MRICFAVAAAGLLLLASNAQAQVYQWKDANGVTHYSQTPPNNRQYQTRNVRGGTNNTAPAQQGVAEAPTESAACTRARGRLTMLESGAALQVEGSDTLLTDEQRQAQIRLARAELQANCTP